MAQPISTIAEFRNYLQLVEERAQHHAKNVDTVILALAGAVVMLSDAGNQLEVRQYRGRTVNVLWLKKRGRRFAFSYNHDANAIELRERSVTGPAISRFTNRSTLREVHDAISQL